MTGEEQRDVVRAVEARLLGDSGSQIVHDLSRRAGEPLVIDGVHPIALGVTKIEVAQPLGAVAATDGHQKEGLLGTARAGHVLGRHGVRHNVVRANKEVDNLVEDLAAVLIGRRGDLLKPQLGERGLHVRRRGGARLVVRGLRVGHGREHGARGGKLVVVGRGILEEPLVIPSHLG